jgi:hypothetical protein
MKKVYFLNLCIIIIILTPYSQEDFEYFLSLIFISFFKF